MCYAICLPHSCNFRRINEVWDGNEYWFGTLSLNTRDQVQ